MLRCRRKGFWWTKSQLRSSLLSLTIAMVWMWMAPHGLVDAPISWHMNTLKHTCIPVNTVPSYHVINRNLHLTHLPEIFCWPSIFISFPNAFPTKRHFSFETEPHIAQGHGLNRTVGPKMTLNSCLLSLCWDSCARLVGVSCMLDTQSTEVQLHRPHLK